MPDSIQRQPGEPQTSRQQAQPSQSRMQNHLPPAHAETPLRPGSPPTPHRPGYPPAQRPDRSPYGPSPTGTPPQHQPASPLPSPARPYRRIRRPARRRFSFLRCGCLGLVFVLSCLALTGAVAVILPGRTNLVLLGIDYVDPGSYAARTDTIMLASFTPQKPSIRILSIPRDLWVTIPGVGENRVNTAHYFAESNQPGSGPNAVIQTIEQNLNIPIDYYLRIKI